MGGKKIQVSPQQQVHVAAPEGPIGYASILKMGLVTAGKRGVTNLPTPATPPFPPTPPSPRIPPTPPATPAPPTPLPPAVQSEPAKKTTENGSQKETKTESRTDDGTGNKTEAHGKSPTDSPLSESPSESFTESSADSPTPFPLPSRQHPSPPSPPSPPTPPHNPSSLLYPSLSHFPPQMDSPPPPGPMLSLPPPLSIPTLDPTARVFTPLPPSPLSSPHLPPSFIIPPPLAYPLMYGHPYCTEMYSPRGSIPLYRSIPPLLQYSPLGTPPLSPAPPRPWEGGGGMVGEGGMEMGGQGVRGRGGYEAGGGEGGGGGRGEVMGRTVLLTGLTGEEAEEELRSDMERWGPIRSLNTEPLAHGSAVVQFYDIRHAQAAVREIQQCQVANGNGNGYKSKHGNGNGISHRQAMEQESALLPSESSDNEEERGPSPALSSSASSEGCPAVRRLFRGRAVGAQFASWQAATDANQGTLVAFNLDPAMPLEELRAAFEVYGPIKELRETPSKKQHRFVEFFDTRHAAAALDGLDGKELDGRRIKIEFSRPGGQARRVRNCSPGQLQNNPGPIPGQLQNCGQIPGQQQHLYGVMGWPTVDGVNMGLPPPPGYMWASYSPVPVSSHMAPPSPVGRVTLNGNGTPQPTWNCGLPAEPFYVGNGHAMGMPMGGENWGGRNGGRGGGGGGGGHGHGQCHGHGGGGMGRGGRGGNGERMRRKTNNQNGVTDAVNFVKGGYSQNGYNGGMTHETLPRGSVRTANGGGGRSRVMASHYAYDEERVTTNPEGPPRTTLMIKNIPNKYSQGMLLALLDQHCLRTNQGEEGSTDPHSSYDFVYLPIDFKNRCNLGYAFVNFTSVAATLKLYRAFHAQQWEAFNSRKVCQVTYARVQGRAALEEHFRNSRFACDTDEYLPLVFDPPRDGEVCPAPIIAAGHLAGRHSPNGYSSHVHIPSRKDQCSLKKDGNQLPNGQSEGASSDETEENPSPGGLQGEQESIEKSKDGNGEAKGEEDRQETKEESLGEEEGGIIHSPSSENDSSEFVKNSSNFDRKNLSALVPKGPSGTEET